MDKSVLISIKPKWVKEIICNKLYEVRKTAPKMDRAFKCLIYATKDKKYGGMVLGNTNIPPIEYGKVVGEFICDEIVAFTYHNLKFEIPSMQDIWGYNIPDNFVRNSKLTYKELTEYGNGKTLYFWHITDLKIYDKPKELSEFSCVGQCCQWNKIEIKENVFGDYVDNCYDNSFCKTCCEYYNHDFGQCDKPYSHFLKRPPQSWCYVETL